MTRRSEANQRVKKRYTTIVAGIHGRKRLTLDYNGLRTVEPYALGKSSAGDYLLWCYQTAGESKSGASWKMLRLDRMARVVVTDTPFTVRPEYTAAPTGPIMSGGIVAQIERMQTDA